MAEGQTLVCSTKVTQIDNFFKKIHIPKNLFKHFQFGGELFVTILFGKICQAQSKLFKVLFLKKLSIWVIFVLHTEFRPAAMFWSGQNVCVHMVVGT